MNNASNNTNNKQKSTPSGIERLKEYKEFIAILVFFFTGVIWIYGYFATKKQVEVVQCISDYNIVMLESRMQKKFLFDEITQKSLELEKLVPEVDLSSKKNTPPNLSDEDKKKIIRLKEQLEITRATLLKTQIRYDEAFDYLKSNKCQNQK